MGLRITTCKTYKNTNWLGHKIKKTGRSNEATFTLDPNIGHRMSNCSLGRKEGQYIVRWHGR